MGAETLEAFPGVPLSGNLMLGVAALSYNGCTEPRRVGGRGGCPDVDFFVSEGERSFDQLGAIPNVAARRVG
jgi:hypothetical protein